MPERQTRLLLRTALIVIGLAALGFGLFASENQQKAALALIAI